MTRTYPHIPFERYADDIICHCKSVEEARALWSALADRFAVCKLCCIRRRRRLSIARMQIGVAAFDAAQATAIEIGQLKHKDDPWFYFLVTVTC